MMRTYMVWFHEEGIDEPEAIVCDLTNDEYEWAGETLHALRQEGMIDSYEIYDVTRHSTFEDLNRRLAELSESRASNG